MICYYACRSLTSDITITKNTFFLCDRPLLFIAKFPVQAGRLVLDVLTYSQDQHTD